MRLLFGDAFLKAFDAICHLPSGKPLPNQDQDQDQNQDQEQDPDQEQASARQHLPSSEHVHSREDPNHRRHTYCGPRFCVPDFLHERFERQLGAEAAKTDLLGYYADVEKDLGDEPIVGKVIDWLERRFARDLQDEFDDSQ